MKGQKLEDLVDDMIRGNMTNIRNIIETEVENTGKVYEEIERVESIIFEDNTTIRRPYEMLKAMIHNDNIIVLEELLVKIFTKILKDIHLKDYIEEEEK